MVKIPSGNRLCIHPTVFPPDAPSMEVEALQFKINQMMLM
jgi:hypothetical protein